MHQPKSKGKLTPEDVFREYYGSQIFNLGDNTNTSTVPFFEDAYYEIEMADATFKEADPRTFIKEIIALNIELFGLAWFRNLSVDLKDSIVDSLLSKEIVFTKQYLQDSGGSDIWQTMSFYSGVITKATADYAFSPKWGRLRDLSAVRTEEDQAKLIQETMTVQVQTLLRHFRKRISDSECVERLINRSVAVPLLKDQVGFTVLTQKLAQAVAERLKCNLNTEGLFAFQRVISGLYVNAVSYLDAVFDYGSYRAAKDARQSLLQTLKESARSHRNTDASP